MNTTPQTAQEAEPTRQQEHLAPELVQGLLAQLIVLSQQLSPSTRLGRLRCWFSAILRPRRAKPALPDATRADVIALLGQLNAIAIEFGPAPAAMSGSPEIQAAPDGTPPQDSPPEPSPQPAGARATPRRIPLRPGSSPPVPAAALPPMPTRPPHPIPRRARPQAQTPPFSRAPDRRAPPPDRCCVENDRAAPHLTTTKTLRISNENPGSQRRPDGRKMAP